MLVGRMAEFDGRGAAFWGGVSAAAGAAEETPDAADVSVQQT